MGDIHLSQLRDKLTNEGHSQPNPVGGFLIVSLVEHEEQLL